MSAILTIGIGKRDIQTLVELLKKNNTQFLIDVRSKPYSKFKPEFNKEAFEMELKRNGIRYDNWTALGGFPESESVLRDGYVNYDDLARMPEFQKHLERLAAAYEKDFRVTILCSEGKPEICHRSQCIGVELTKIEVPVEHIDENGRIVSQESVMLKKDKNQASLPGLEPVRHSRKRWVKGAINE